MDTMFEIADALRCIVLDLQGIREDMKAQSAVDIVTQDPAWSDLTFPISMDGFPTKHNY